MLRGEWTKVLDYASGRGAEPRHGDILRPQVEVAHPKMLSELLSAAILLILVIDPFGNVPLVVSALQATPSARRRWVVLRECVIAYAVLLAFLFGGRGFLMLMHVSETSLSIAGGVILFLIALRMVFSHPDGVFGDATDSEPLLVPLAIPAIAGPSALATVMLMASREPEHIDVWLLALTLAMAVTTLVLLAAGRLQRLLGERGMRAFERLMGLVLTAVAVEMLLTGIKSVAVQFRG